MEKPSKMSRSEQRIAWLVTAVVVLIGLFAVARIAPGPPLRTASAATLPCGLEKHVSAEQGRKLVDYLVGLGMKSGTIPAITAEELRRATGTLMPDELLPCLQDYARARLLERRNPSARSLRPSRSPSLVRSAMV